MLYRFRESMYHIKGRGIYTVADLARIDCGVW